MISTFICSLFWLVMHFNAKNFSKTHTQYAFTLRGFCSLNRNKQNSSAPRSRRFFHSAHTYLTLHSSMWLFSLTSSQSQNRWTSVVFALQPNNFTIIFRDSYKILCWVFASVTSNSPSFQRISYFNSIKQIKANCCKVHLKWVTN